MLQANIISNIQKTLRSSVASSGGSGGGEPPFIPINLIGVSEQFDNAAWSKVRATVTANTANAPTGALTADKLIATSVATDHKISKAVAGCTASVAYTFSVYLKQAGLQWVALYNAVGKGQYFDLQNGTVGGVFIGAPSDATIADAGGGWWRCSITATSATTTLTHVIFLANGATGYSFTGDDIAGVYAWGAQLEIGSTVNTYIPAPQRVDNVSSNKLRT